MCPLRFILIFLSATLAGFFLFRNLKSPQDFEAGDNSEDNSKDSDSNSSLFSQVLVILLRRNLAFPFFCFSLFVYEWNDCGMFEQASSAMKSVFWTAVDMASGRYLWRHLVPSSKKASD
ncbi:unnamed protein product [Citrullus colocynthis]|uniref:Uncharacterized protein n=1 Tax=Citrullus colocynthis TaxID=252529 RepID=A0ABP0ZGA1_9ROSI